MASYREEVIKAMKLLAEDPRTIFIGQSVHYSGPVDIKESLEEIPDSKKLEVPVFEDTQLGFSIGLALEGFIPVTIYPRMDFLLLALNQLVNHLDKIEKMSCGRFSPRVIVRTVVGTIRPLNPGPQHCQDHTEALKLMLTNVDVVKLETAEDIVPAYRRALESPRSTVLVELGEKIRSG